MCERRTVPVSLLFSLAFLVFCVAATGCGYKVFVKGVTPGDPPAALQTGASFHIQESDQTDTSDDFGEVSTPEKIAKLLHERGYAISAEQDADYILIFDYDKEAMLGKKQVEPLSGVSSGVHSVRREGPYSHRLSINVLKAEPFRAHRESEIVWAGGAVTEITSLHSPKTVDLLLVAVFDRFGEATGQTDQVRLGFHDPRALDLREP